jgi:hypothetical protein
MGWREKWSISIVELECTYVHRAVHKLADRIGSRLGELGVENLSPLFLTFFSISNVDEFCGT